MSTQYTAEVPKTAADAAAAAAAADGALDTADFTVAGMDCASCVVHVEKAAKSVPGVRSVNVSLARGRAVVEFDPSATDLQRVADAITDSGYPARPEVHAHANAEEHRVAEHAAHAGSWFRRAMIGIALWLPVELLHWTLVFTSGAEHFAHRYGWMNWLSLVTSTIAIVYVGWAFYKSAWRALLRGTSNMDTLIAMGASVAYVYSLVAFFGYLARWWGQLPDLYFTESTGLRALISLGHWLEARARTAAGSAIRELLNLAPATALLIEENVGSRELGVGSEDTATLPPTSHAPHPNPREVPVAEL